jgi:ABC-type nickel/cobalt efflux system permease component RcnA
MLSMILMMLITGLIPCAAIIVLFELAARRQHL